jgi:hypothetical protein
MLEQPPFKRKVPDASSGGPVIWLRGATVFVMSRNPTAAEIEQAVAILKKFIYSSLTSVGGLGKFAAGAASGYVSFQLLNDPAKRAAVGPLYSKLRLVFLGQYG